MWMTNKRRGGAWCLAVNACICCQNGVDSAIVSRCLWPCCGLSFLVDSVPLLFRYQETVNDYSPAYEGTENMFYFLSENAVVDQLKRTYYPNYYT